MKRLTHAAAKEHSLAAAFLFFMHLTPVSFGGTNINSTSTYEAFFIQNIFDMPRYRPVRVSRTGRQPLVGGVEGEGRTLFVEIYLGESGTMAGVKSIFDPSDEQAKAFVAIRSDGTQVYVMAICSELRETADGSGLVWVATLEIDGEVNWLAVSAATTAASITTSGQTFTVPNAGDMEAYPKFTTTPTGGKSGDTTYQAFCPAEWGYSFGVASEPIDIANVALDTRTGSTNFASTTGDDIRVFVDGRLVNFWLGGINTATTRVWVNLDFVATVPLTLSSALTDSATTIAFNESIANLPSTGLLKLNSGEIVTYGSKNEAAKTVGGVARGVKNTTAAAQTLGTAVTWLQHDILITYGDSSLTAYVTDDSKKPVFDLDNSTNTSWVYSGVFGDDNRLRSGGWTPAAGLGGSATDSGYCFTRDHSTSGAEERVSPWDAVGVAQNSEGLTRFTLHNPRGISAANFTLGKSKTANSAAVASFARVESSSDGNAWTTEYSIPATVNTSWTAWSQNVTGIYTSSIKETGYISLVVEEGADDAEAYKAQVTAVTVTLQNGITAGFGSEFTSYSADIVIGNDTTGQSMRLTMPIGTSVPVEIDTAAHTAVRTDNGISVLGSIDDETLRRKRWLTLATGNNTISVTESGLTAISVSVDVVARYYD